MPVVKKRNLQTETRLLLEGNEPIELPPAEIEDHHVLVQFDKFKPFIGELLEELRDGTLAEPVPVMNDGSTFERGLARLDRAPARLRVQAEVAGCPEQRGNQQPKKPRSRFHRGRT